MPVSVYAIFLVSLILVSGLPWYAKAVMVGLLIAGIEVKEFYVDRRRDHLEHPETSQPAPVSTVHAVGFGLPTDDE